MRLQRIFLLLYILSWSSSLFAAQGRVNQNKRASIESPATPQKVGSKCDGGETLQGPEGSRRFIAHAGAALGGTSRRWLGSDGYRGLPRNLSPFQKVFEKQAVKGPQQSRPSLPAAQLKCQLVTASGGGRAKLKSQSWWRLTEWLLYSLSGGKWNRDIVLLSYRCGEHWPRSKCEKQTADINI